MDSILFCHKWNWKKETAKRIQNTSCLSELVFIVYKKKVQRVFSVTLLKMRQHLRWYAVNQFIEISRFCSQTKITLRKWRSDWFTKSRSLNLKKKEITTTVNFYEPNVVAANIKDIKVHLMLSNVNENQRNRKHNVHNKEEQTCKFYMGEKGDALTSLFDTHSIIVSLYD